MSDADIVGAMLADWKRRFGEHDIHSISAQIASMLWRSAFYRSINESRRFLPENKDGQKKANGPLHELIDDGYFILNATAMRRLLDKGAASGPRGVYSLYGLIRDIKTNARLLTRANVLKARNLEYDFEPMKQRAFETARQEARARGSQGYFISKDGWAEAEYWHGAMDQLCGVTTNNRGAGDIPDETKLDWLLHELEEHGRNVQDWVDKFVAHAASPESRQTLHPEHQTLSLAKLWLSERVVVRIASFISRHFIDGMNLGGVPIPQFDQFASLDRPFIEPAGLEAMHRAWERHHQEIASCQNWAWDHALTTELDVWKDADIS